MKREQEDFEIIDVDDDTDDVELLDFKEQDQAVSREIDNMLDFIDASDSNKPQILTELVESTKDYNPSEINNSLKPLKAYEPSIKDFNIKNEKTRKIVHKAMLYVIILMLVGFEFFINDTGNSLNELKVYASDNQPIKIIQNEKYGYIDQNGNKLVNPKYTYAEDFVRGYAIVKNGSNVPLIIDKAGKEVAKAGNYFSIYRAGENIVAAKSSKGGLKYALLTSNLKNITEFKYDNLTYLETNLSFIKDNTVGLLNMNGKEIYSYKLTDTDEKSISLVTSSVTDKSYQRYGVVTVNKSSSVINLEDGAVVYPPTLNEIVPEENNVFYENIDGVRRYFYVQDNKIVLESDDYSSLNIASIKAGVLKALRKDNTYEFISTATKEQFVKNLSLANAYLGDDAFIYSTRNYRKNINTYTLVKNGKIIKNIDNISGVERGYKNGYAIAKLSDGSFNYIDLDGNLLNDEHYIEAQDFDELKTAIVKTNDGYGVINDHGSYILNPIYKEILTASSESRLMALQSPGTVFYAAREVSKFVLYDKNGKRIGKEYYDEIVFDKKYPVLKAANDVNDMLITTENQSKIMLTSYNTKYQAFENYIIVKNEYYNYEGKLIYVDNSKGDESE